MTLSSATGLSVNDHNNTFLSRFCPALAEIKTPNFQCIQIMSLSFLTVYLYLWSSLPLLPLLFLLLLELLVLLLYQSDQCVASTLQLEGGTRLDEPIKSKLWAVTNRCTNLIVNILFVKAKLVKHTDLKGEVTESYYYSIKLYHFKEYLDGGRGGINLKFKGSSLPPMHTHTHEYSRGTYLLPLYSSFLYWFHRRCVAGGRVSGSGPSWH